jgi:sodium transport system permease protein
MSNDLLTIVKKELKRVFDDKRLVFTAIILPALAIAVIYSIMGMMIDNMVDTMQQHVPIVYVENAPEEFLRLAKTPAYLTSMELNDANGDLESIKSQIYSGEVDLLIVFEDDTEVMISNYQDYDRLPNITTFYNSSEDNSSTARFRLFPNLLEQYEKMIIGYRLGNAQYASVFAVDRIEETHDIVDEQKAAGRSFSTLFPVLITIFLFSGGMGIGMDTIAGEKERGTMATLLITPVKRETIAFGKIIGLGIISFISAISSFIGIVASLPFSKALFATGSGDVSLGALGFGVSEFALLLALMVTMVGVFVGFISLLSVFAKNVKEAGTYVTPLFMIIMVLGFMNMFNMNSVELSTYAIPIYGSVAALRAMFMFEASTVGILITCLVNIVLTGVLVVLIKNMFNNEKIMFSA